MDLQCDICFYPYDVNCHQPKSLPCGHTICKLCVENPGINGKCPTCREDILHLDPSKLPNNFALIQMMQKATTAHSPIKQQLHLGIRAGRKLVDQLQQLVPVAVARLNHLIYSSDAQVRAMEDEFEKLGKEAGQYEGQGLVGLVERRLELENKLRLLTIQSCSVVAVEEAGTSWRASTTPAETADHMLGLLLLQLRTSGLLKEVDDCADPAAAAPYVGPPWTPAVLIVKPSDVEQGRLNVNKILQDECRWGHVRRLEDLRGRDSERLLRVVAPYLEELSTALGSATPSVMEEVRKMRSLKTLAARCDSDSKLPYPDLPLHLEALLISDPTEKQLRCLQRMPKLRSLAVWNYVGPEVRFPPSQPAKLLWLQVAVDLAMKTTMMSLIRAYAPSLQELHVFCSVDHDQFPDNHFPDLALDLATCGLSTLRRLVLWRPGPGCKRVDACLVQRRAIRDGLPTQADVSCINCKVTLI